MMHDLGTKLGVCFVLFFLTLLGRLKLRVFPQILARFGTTDEDSKVPCTIADSSNPETD